MKCEFILCTEEAKEYYVISYNSLDIFRNLFSSPCFRGKFVNTKWGVARYNHLSYIGLCSRHLTRMAYHSSNHIKHIEEAEYLLGIVYGE